jgi:hypothetical protein
VVTILQLISHFTRPDQQPRRGIVAMLNNGEEDFLWGSRAFGYSPLLPFTDSFLNLEGAGAGGRALVFRTTDQEVTAAYGRVAPNPFGSIVASDGFKMGLISSETDYSVFSGVYGLRGLDMAFYKPRARYHSNQDDADHASVPSVWHMLDNSVHALRELTAQSPTTFAKGAGTQGVWFDTFGKAFAMISMSAMFGWSVALLVAGPVVLAVVSLLLVRADKYYFFAGSLRYRGRKSQVSAVNGWNGFFRFPVALIVSILAVVAACYCVIGRNPYIVYSNNYVM